MNLVMMGTGLFAEPTFDALLASPHRVVGLFTQPDRAVGQERGSTRQTGRGMKAIAQEHHVPVFQPESVNTPEGVAMLRELHPDLVVIAAFGQILKAPVLDVPKFGAINVHASLLPKYRGAAPIAWAIYHGETRTGVTIFKLTVGLDSGDMLAKEAIDIGPDEMAGEVEARLAPIGARLAALVVDRFAAGPVAGEKQDPAQATKAPKLKKEDGLIDWTRGDEQVCNQIRAMQPWPTAYTFFHASGKPPLRLIICRAVVNTDVDFEFPLTPGELSWSSNPPYLIAGTGSGPAGVKILELQPAGKKRMTAEEFLRGRKPQPGDRLGSEQP